MCKPSKYAIIQGDRIYHGFRCSKHGVAASPRFNSLAELKVGIKTHKKSKQKKS
jgi:hypothetical protein